MDLKMLCVSFRWLDTPFIILWQCDWIPREWSCFFLSFWVGFLASSNQDLWTLLCLLGILDRGLSIIRSLWLATRKTRRGTETIQGKVGGENPWQLRIFRSSLPSTFYLPINHGKSEVIALRTFEFRVLNVILKVKPFARELSFAKKLPKSWNRLKCYHFGHSLISKPQKTSS